MRLVFPASAPCLEDEEAIIILIVSNGQAGVVGYLWENCGLLFSVINRIVFRVSNVTGDPGEHDLRIYRVESVNGKVNALYERVSSIGICERVERRASL